MSADGNHTFGLDGLAVPPCRTPGNIREESARDGVERCLTELPSTLDMITARGVDMAERERYRCSMC